MGCPAYPSRRQAMADPACRRKRRHHITEASPLKTFESKTATAARAAAGILLSVALTAGAAMGVAAELQRGFSPAYEAMAGRREAARSSLSSSARAPKPAPSRTAGRAVAPASRGG